MADPMKIAFVLQTFGAGGAERVATLLCNAWAEAGHTVTAITFEAPNEAGFHVLDEAVSLRQIDALNTSARLLARAATNVRRVARLRALLRELEPDAIVAFTTEANVVTLWSALGLGVPVVVSERNQPDRPALGRVHLAARRVTYPAASAIVVQTEAVADWARQRFRVPVHILPNPVDLRAAPLPERRASTEKRLLAVGRLVPQKGFDRLIASFARLAEAHPDWRLTIYGEGTERAALEAQVRSFGLSERVSMPGLCKDLLPVFAEVDQFVLPSRYEGAPNVLLEALAAGCPVVATDCPGAVAEILAEGRFGLLVANDEGAVTKGLDRMMSDEGLRARYAAAAPEAVRGFDVRVVAGRWLDLLSSLTTARWSP